MFIDIHNHILPYIDDGARDIACALDMLKIAEAQGIKEIIATPHYIQGVTNYNSQDIYQSYHQVAELIAKNNLDIKIHVGNEIFLDIDSIKNLADKKCLTLANSDYILIELSNRWNNTVIDNILYELKIKGYKVVLAHIERYDYFIEHPNILRSYIIEEGVYCQVNADSITCKDRKKRKYIKKLIERNYVHFVATDAHSCNRRGPYLKEAYSIVESYIGNKAGEIFILNGKKVIENKNIEVDMPQKI